MVISDAQPLVVGLCHQEASLAELGRATLRREALAGALGRLRDAGLEEAVVLSTCSRIEVCTTTTGSADQRAGAVLDAMSEWSGLPRDRIGSLARVLVGREAVDHLFRVTAGLESRLVGDTDVLAQVRGAWRAAGEAGTAGPLTGRLLPASIRCAQQVHTRTPLGRQRRSLARRAVDVGVVLAAPDGTRGLRVLVVGSGQMAQVACEHLATHGLACRVVARDPSYAARLVGPGRACAWERLADEVARADLVLCATSALHHVLTRDQVSAAMAARHVPLTIVDLAVPGNVDPGARGVEGVRLVDLTTLGDDARHDPAVAAAVRDATLLVEQAARRFCDDLAAAHAGPVIRAVREQVERTCREELRRHGGPSDPAALAEAVHAIVGKVMHRPALMARAAAAAGDDRALHLLCDAFGVAPPGQRDAGSTSLNSWSPPASRSSSGPTFGSSWVRK